MRYLSPYFILSKELKEGDKIKIATGNKGVEEGRSKFSIVCACVRIMKRLCFYHFLSAS